MDARPLGGVVGNSLLVVGRTLYVGFSSIENIAPLLADLGVQCCSHQGFVVAFDIRGGSELWRTTFVPEAAPLPEGVSPHGSTVGPSGADVWGQPTYDRKAVANDVVYAVSPGGVPVPDLELPDKAALLALDADTGAVLARRELSGRAISSPVVTGGRGYVGEGSTAVEELGVDATGGLSAFGLPDDAALW